MTTETVEVIVREIDIEASPETVFAFFVDPAKLTQWLAVEATLDARPGGICHQVHAGRPGRGPFHLRGEFLELDPPNRVVFSWGFIEPEIGVPPGASTVEVTLSPSDTGTRVRLVHRGLPAAEIEGHSGGWTVMLDRLRAAVIGS
ncbi:MAG TPA: SRPBCC domain-containing protein [Pseudonocardia sp.]|jgi:uncharacterized protein YndB with AHSA1/START domain